MAKHWRHKLSEKVPEKDQLVPNFSRIVDSIVDIVYGRVSSSTSRYLQFWFLKNVSRTLLDTRSSTISTDTLLVVRELIERCAHLSEEDVRQQALLIVVEMWSFYREKVKPGRRTKFVFYDYVRFNLVKHIGTFVGNQLLLQMGDMEVPRFSEEAWMEDPELIDFSLGWILLKSNVGPLADMTIREKYLLYLRYGRNMTIKEIAALTKRHRASIENDFSRINKLFELGGIDVSTRIKR